MSSLASQRRGIKNYRSDASRRKSPLTVDLNSPPSAPPDLHAEGTSAVAESSAAARAATSLIDVEAIEEDDVQMLSSPGAFFQARNRLRSRAAIVVLDEDSESSPGPSVINVNDHLSRVPLSNFKRNRMLFQNKIAINCEAYVNVEDDHNAKRRKAANPRNGRREEAVSEGPSFSCPICMGSLIDACSTICGHVFCQACIRTALQSQKKCPTCRRSIKANGFHRLFLSSH